MKKKLLVTLLSFVMVVTMMPLNVFAQASAADNANTAVSQNYNEDEYITADKLEKGDTVKLPVDNKDGIVDEGTIDANGFVDFKVLDKETNETTPGKGVFMISDKVLKDGQAYQAAGTSKVYADSDLNVWCNNLLEAMPENLQNSIIPITKHEDSAYTLPYTGGTAKQLGETDISSQKIFAPSTIEAFGTCDSSGGSVVASKYFANDAAREAVSGTGAVVGWWNRTPSYDPTSLTAGTQRTAGGFNFGKVTNSLGYRPSLNLQNDTVLKKIDDNTYAWALVHTVQFELNGHGEKIDPQSVEDGSKVTKPADPTEDGWAFKGWYADKELKTPFDFDTPVIKSFDLYAKWVQVHTVQFELNGHGDLIEPQSVENGSKVTKPADPTASGWSFKGWYTDKELKIPFDFSQPLDTTDATVYLYAKWEAQTGNPITIGQSDHVANIKLDKEVAEKGEVVTVTADAVDPSNPITGVKVFSDTSNDVYEFNADNAELQFVMPDSPVTIVVEVQRYNITGEISGGGEIQISPSMQTSGGFASFAVKNIPEGYHLDLENSKVLNKLTQAETGIPISYYPTDDIYYFVMPSFDTHIKAVVVKDSYSITYDSTDKFKVDGPASSEVGEPVKVTVDVKPGYEFDHITVNGEPQGHGVKEFTMPSENVKVSAIVNPIKYDLTLNQPEGDGHGTLTSVPAAGEGVITVEDEIVVTYTPGTKYQLDKFVIVDEGGNPIRSAVEGNVATFSIPKSNPRSIKVSVEEKAILYDIDIDSTLQHVKLSTVPEKQQLAGEKVQINADVEEGWEVYEFVVEETSGGRPVSVDEDGIFVMPDYNVTVSANVGETRYDTTIYPYPIGAGTAIAKPPRQEAGSEVQLTASAAEGYEFSGYVAFATLTGDEIDVSEAGVFTMPVGGAVVVPVFETTKFSVEVTPAKHGELWAFPLEQTPGDDVWVSYQKEDPGYDVQLFYREDGQTAGTLITGNTFVMPENDVTVYAEETLHDYTISAETAEGGSIEYAETANVGDTVEPLGITPNDGYEFAGVEVENLTTHDYFTSEDGEFTMPASNVLVTPIFEKTVYDITPSPVDHGKISTDVSKATIGEDVVVNCETDDGYSATTITIYKDGELTPYETITGSRGTFEMPASNVEIRAEIIADTHEITNDPPVEHGTLTYESESSTPNEYHTDDLIKVAYVPYAGWEKDVIIEANGEEIIDNQFTMPAEDVNIVVQEKQIEYTIDIDSQSLEHGSIVTIPQEKQVAGESVAVYYIPSDLGYTAHLYYSKAGEPERILIENNAFTMPLANVTIYAVEEEDEYTVTAKSVDEGSIAYGEGTHHYNSKVECQDISPNPGYHFVGALVRNLTTDEWFPTEADGSFTMPASNVEVTPIFEVNEYNINVDKQDGVKVNVYDTALYKSEVGVVCEVQEGYSLDTITITPVDTSIPEIIISGTSGTFTMPASDVSISTNVHKNVYKIINDPPVEHGTLTIEPETREQAYGEDVSLTYEADEGWDPDVQFRVNGELIPSSTFKMPAADAYVKVEEKIKTFDVNVNPAEHGTITILTDTPVVKGESVIVKYEPQTGWEGELYYTTDTEPMVKVPITGNVFPMPADNVTVGVDETQINYNISVTQSVPEAGGSIEYPEFAHYGDTVSPKEIITNEGYVFAGVVITKPDGSIFTSDNGSFTMPADIVSVKPYFDFAEYKITADEVEGGKIVVDETAKYTSVVDVSCIAEQGYQVQNIIVTSEDGATVVAKIDGESGPFTMPAFNVKVTATIKAIQYSIINSPAVEHGKFTAAPNPGTVGDEITLNYQPEEGWSENVTFVVDGKEITGNTFTMPASDVYVQVNEKAIDFKVSVSQESLEHGTLYAYPESAHYGDNVYVYYEPVDLGYDVSFYYTDKDGETTVITNNTFRMPASDVVVHAEETQHPYNINVENPTEGGSISYDSATAFAGDNVKPEALIVDSGYSLDRVDVLDVETGELVHNTDGSFIMPLSDVTVTPVFTKEQYGVFTIQPEGGALYADPYLAYYDQEVIVSCVADYGYEVNTITVKDATGEIVTEITGPTGTFNMPASYVTVTAELSKTDHNVILTPAEHGTLSADYTSAPQGTEITLSYTPNEGWSEDVIFEVDGVAISGKTFEMPNHDVHVRVIEKAIPFDVKVTQPQYGKLIVKPETATVGETVYVYYEATTPGYDVELFYEVPETNETVPITDGWFTMPASNVNVFAVETQHDYNITISNPTGGGTVAYPETANAGESVSAQSVTPDTGYYLAGIFVLDETIGELVPSVQGTFIMPASDVTVIPVFLADVYNVEIIQPDHATITVDKTQAGYDEQIEVSCKAEYGYSVDKITVIDSKGQTVKEITGPTGTFNMPADNVKISATLSSINHEVVLTSAEHGEFTASPMSAPQGTQISLIYQNPEEGWSEDVTFEVDGAPIIGSTFAMPNHDVNARVIEKAIDYTITIDDQTPTYGKVTTDPAETAQFGEKVKIIDHPEAGYALSECTVINDKTGEEITVEDGAFEMPSSSVTITDTFADEAYNISLIQPATGGTIELVDPVSGQAIEGQEVTLKSIPIAGYKLLNWTVLSDEGESIVVKSNKFIMPGSDVTVTASFTKQSYAINIDEGSYSHGYAYSNPSPTATGGQIVSLYYVPDGDWSLDHFEVYTTKEQITVTEDNTFKMPNAAVTVQVFEVQNQHKITIDQEIEHGTVTSDPVGQQAAGKKVKLTNTAELGYDFDEYIVTGASSGHIIPVSASGEFVMPQENVKVSATFVPHEYTITLKTEAGGVESFRAFPPTQVGGGTVELSYTLEPGYEFSRYEMAYIDPQTGQLVTKSFTENTFEMPFANVEIDLHAELHKYAITIDQDEECGTVSAHPGSAEMGEKVTLTNTPQPGWEVNSYEIYTGSAKYTIDTNTFEMPGCDIVVVPLWEKIEFSIDVQDVDSHGTTIASPSGQPGDPVHAGDEVTLTTEFDPGYELSHYIVKTSKGTVDVHDTNKFTMPAEDVAVYEYAKLSVYDVTIHDEGIHADIEANIPQAAMGTTIHLSCTPETGYELINYIVRDINHDPVDVTADGTFEMPVGGAWVTAAIGHTEYPIRVKQPEHGQLDAQYTKAHYGDEVLLAFYADAGYETGDITVIRLDTKKVVAKGKISSFIMPDSSVEITAETTAKTYNITAEPSVGGEIKVQSTAQTGENVKLAFEPSTGFHLVRFIVEDADGQEVPVTHDGTFTMPGKNVTVYASVEKDGYEIRLLQPVHGLLFSNLQRATYGDTVRLGCLPDVGFRVEGYHVIGRTTDIQLGPEGEFAMPNEDVVVEATVVPIGYSITVQTPQHGEITVDPQLETYRVNENVKLSYSVDPESGWEFDRYHVYYDDHGIQREVPVTSDGVFKMPAANTVVSVVEKRTPYKVNVHQPAHGTLSADTDYAAVGDIVTLSYTADPGYEFDGYDVYSAQGDITVENNQFTMPAGEVNARVILKPIIYDINISQTPDTHGTITADMEKASVGDVVTLGFTPDAGYELDQYSVIDADGQAVKVTQDGTFVMPAKSVTVSATSKAIEYDINVLQAEHAYYTVPTRGTVGQQITIKQLYIEEGYELRYFVVNGEPITGNTFTMPAGNVVIVPIVLPITSKIIVDTEGIHGKLTTAPESTALTGQVVKVNYEPDAGYELARYLVTDAAGKAVPVTQDGEFLMPSSDVNVGVVEKIIDYNVLIDQPEHATVYASKDIAHVGDKVYLIANPTPGYALDYFTVDGEQITGNSFDMPAHDVHVSAVTKNVVYNVNVLTVAAGTITANPTEAIAGQKIYLTFTPNPGYKLDHYVVNKIPSADPVVVSADGIFEMPACDVDVSAIAQKTENHVDVVQPENGKLSVDPTVARMGDTVRLFFEADPGYTLDKYVVTTQEPDPQVVEVTSDGTFEMPAYSVTATAIVKKQLNHISYWHSDHGKVDGPDEAALGDVVELTAIPDEGWQLESIRVTDTHGYEIPVVDNSFVMPATTATVKATFAPIDPRYVPDVQGFVAYAPDCKSIHVEWDKIESDNIHYWLYKGDLPTGDWGGPIAILDNNDPSEYIDFDVTAGHKNYYVMRAAVKVGDEWVFGNYTSIDYGWPRPADIENFVAWASDAETANVEWSQAAEPEVQYFLYKTTCPTGDWGDRIAVLANDETKYTDTDVQVDQKYYYVVRGAYLKSDGTYAFGNYSNVDYAWPRVAPVTGFQAWAPDATSVNLVWDQAYQENVKYYIYRGTKPYGDWGAPIVLPLDRATTHYEDYDVQTGQKYYYLIRAGQRIDGRMYYSDYSEMDYAWPR